MYGICNCGFKKDELNIYFTAYDNISCFSTDSPYSPVVSVHVCTYCSETIHVDYIFISCHVHTYTYIYFLFDPHVHCIHPHGTLYVPTHTFYSTHTVHIYFLFDPHIHYLYPHGTLINVRTHLRKYE